MSEVGFVVPGPLETRTGGYVYDRRIIAGLRALGWAVTVQTTPDLAALPDGRLTVVDGLALGMMPEEAERHVERLRLVGLVHHPLALETGLSGAQQAALFESERRALASTWRVIVTSPRTRADLVPYGIADARVVEPGTDPAPLANGSTLLSVATITPRKGHDVLIEAMARLRDRPWQLELVGSLERAPEFAAAVQARVMALGLGERIRFLGELEDESLAQAYARAGLFVLASHHEGYGMVLTEALARGLPIVATAAGAIPDTVPVDAGMLVPPGDVGALADALGRILDDPDLRERLAAGARRARQRLPHWDQAAAAFAAALA